MSKTVEQLKEALRQEISLYESLMEMADQKTLVVVRNKIQELEVITAKEQQFIREMGRFEQIRQSLLAHFSKEKELEEPPASLSALLSFLSEEEQEEVEDLRQKLLALIQEFSEKNSLNEKLIKQSLEIIQTNLELMTQKRTTTSYDQKADDEKKKQTRQIFDARY